MEEISDSALIFEDYGIPYDSADDYCSNDEKDCSDDETEEYSTETNDESNDEDLSDFEDTMYSNYNEHRTKGNNNLMKNKQEIILQNVIILGSKPTVDPLQDQSLECNFLNKLYSKRSLGNKVCNNEAKHEINNFSQSPKVSTSQLIDSKDNSVKKQALNANVYKRTTNEKVATKTPSNTDEPVSGSHCNQLLKNKDFLIEQLNLAAREKYLFAKKQEYIENLMKDYKCYETENNKDFQTNTTDVTKQINKDTTKCSKRNGSQVEITAKRKVKSNNNIKIKIKLKQKKDGSKEYEITDSNVENRVQDQKQTDVYDRTKTKLHCMDKSENKLASILKNEVFNTPCHKNDQLETKIKLNEKNHLTYPKITNPDTEMIQPKKVTDLFPINYFEESRIVETINYLKKKPNNEEPTKPERVQKFTNNIYINTEKNQMQHNVNSSSTDSKAFNNLNDFEFQKSQFKVEVDSNVDIKCYTHRVIKKETEFFEGNSNKANDRVDFETKVYQEPNELFHNVDYKLTLNAKYDFNKNNTNVIKNKNSSAFIVFEDDRSVFKSTSFSRIISENFMKTFKHKFPHRPIKSKASCADDEILPKRMKFEDMQMVT